MAKASRINGDVYRDSCVEFFVSINGSSNYYHFEFNCIGIPNVGYGPGRANRVLTDPEILKAIKVRSSLGNQPFDEKTPDYHQSAYFGELLFE